MYKNYNRFLAYIIGITLAFLLQGNCSAYFSPNAGSESYFYNDLYFASWRLLTPTVSFVNTSTHFEMEKPLPSGKQSLYFSITGVGTIYYLLFPPIATQLKFYYKSAMPKGEMSWVIGTTATFGQSNTLSLDGGIVVGKDINSWVRLYLPLILSIYNNGYILNYSFGTRCLLFGSNWGLDLGLRGARLSTFSGDQKNNDLNLVLGLGVGF